MEQRYFTLKQTAKVLGVTQQTLRNWDKQNKLRSVRNPINNYRMYKVELVQLFMRRMEERKRIIF